MSVTVTVLHMWMLNIEGLSLRLEPYLLCFFLRGDRMLEAVVPSALASVGASGLGVSTTGD